MGLWYQKYTNYLRISVLVQIKHPSNLVPCFQHKGIKKVAWRCQNRVRKINICFTNKNAGKETKHYVPGFQPALSKTGMCLNWKKGWEAWQRTAAFVHFPLQHWAPQESLGRVDWVALGCTSEHSLKPPKSYQDQWSQLCSPTKGVGGVATALPELRGDLKAPLHYSRKMLILGHITAVLPSGLSAFFHFIVTCTKILKMHGDCTGTNVTAGFFFFYISNSLSHFYPYFTLLFSPLPVGLSNGSKLSEMPSIKMNEIPVKHMAESFLAKANNTCLN